MIHAVCDFCGKDCDRVATLITMTPFQNFARHRTDIKPFGNVDAAKSFVICSECIEKNGFPNPHDTYSAITRQRMTYDKKLNNYTNADLIGDR